MSPDQSDQLVRGDVGHYEVGERGQGGGTQGLRQVLAVKPDIPHVEAGEPGLLAEGESVSVPGHGLLPDEAGQHGVAEGGEVAE